MKRTSSVLGYILFALVVLLPFGRLVCACFGYTFELVNITVFAAITAFLSIFLVILCIIEKESCESRIIKVLFALLAPLSLINAVFYMLESSGIWVIACVLICAGCCLFLTIKRGKPRALKITTFVLSALMISPVGYLGFIAFLFGNIGKDTVVQSVESPNGMYDARVIDSDQGALGGDTLVDVYEHKGINALVFKISKKPQRVYWGEWGEFENMEIYWKDDSCLIINSVEYEIE